MRKAKTLAVPINKGKSEFVVHDRTASQDLRNLAARKDAMEGIRQGLEDPANGRTRPAREALAEFRAKNGIPRWLNDLRAIHHRC